MIHPLQSAQNPKLKHLKKLLTQRAYRVSHQQFVIESPIFIHDLLNKNPQAIDCIVTTEDKAADYSHNNDRSIYTAPQALLKPLASGTFQGVFAIAHQPTHSFSLPRDNHTLLLLDQVQNPSNMGAIIRNAAAFDVDAILLTKGTVDPFHPDSVKGMAGNGLDIPFIEVDHASFTRDFAHTSWYILSPDAEQPLKDTTFPSCRGFIFGSEGHGIRTPFIHNIQSTGLKINQKKNVDSLNVAVSTGILLHSLF